MREALRRVAPVVVFAVIPLASVVTMLVIAHGSESLAIDFRRELYPEAEEILAGRNPFPPLGTDLSRGENLIWPPAAALLVSPLTILPPAAADVAIALIGLACFGFSLWLVGVRDWRVYGLFALWPQVVGEMRTAHLTPVLCVAVALAWRYRERSVGPGVAVGLAVAVKLFVWPVGLWLAAIGRVRGALTAGALGALSLLLVLPFAGLGHYAQLLIDLGRTFDQDAYTAYGFLAQLGVASELARGAGLVSGFALLAAMWWTRSLALAVAASLALSPIVWLDYYALCAVPLAIVRPRLSAIWFLPIVTWGLPSAGIGTGDPWSVARVLGVFATVVVVTVLAERGDRTNSTSAATRPIAGGVEPMARPN